VVEIVTPFFYYFLHTIGLATPCVTRPWLAFFAVLGAFRPVTRFPSTLVLAIVIVAGTKRRASLKTAALEDGIWSLVQVVEGLITRRFEDNFGLTTEKTIGYRSSRSQTQRYINNVVGRRVLMMRCRDDGVEMT